MVVTPMRTGSAAIAGLAARRHPIIKIVDLICIDVFLVFRLAENGAQIRRAPCHETSRTNVDGSACDDSSKIANRRISENLAAGKLCGTWRGRALDERFHGDFSGPASAGRVRW
jgi:hypothetical protein